MEAIAVLNRSVASHLSLLSIKPRQVAARDAGRPLSSSLCGSCLKAWRQGRTFAFDGRRSSPGLHQSNSNKRHSVTTVQASAVLSGDRVLSPHSEPIIPILHSKWVETLHSREDLDRVVKEAKDHLVVVEYGTSENESVQQMHPAIVQLAATCPDVKFAQILGDESDETEALMDEANVKSIPHYVFYKNGEKIHEESGINEEMLTGDVLYYGDTTSQVVDIRTQADLTRLFDEAGNKLVVLDMGLKFCGPCVKVYPTVVKLARKMAGFAVFARVMGDENEYCEQLLQRNKVLEVPTFIFLKGRKQQARYVGSSRGSLIGEILKLQGACQ